MSWRGDALEDRLAVLSDLLEAWRPVWTVRSFHHRHLPWEVDHPALATWLRTLAPDDVRALEADPHARPGPAPWRDLVDACAAATDLGPVRASSVARALPTDGVKARKRDQIAALRDVLAPSLGPGDVVVEWCAGRGHLGRGLAAATGCAALLLERDPALCGPPVGPELPGVRHLQVDVTAPHVPDLLPGGATLVGLHACGDLTDRLLAVADAAGCHHLAVAPCCHWRVAAVSWSPRSAAGRARDPRLDRAALQLAVLGEVTASAGRVADRERAATWRAALDHVAREVTGTDAHHGFRSVPRAWFRGAFGAFRARVADTFGLPVTTGPTDADALAAGHAHVWRSRALGLPRLRLGRALELWVDLDRALALREAGWEVEVGTFCPPEATPRNVLLHAQR